MPPRTTMRSWPARSEGQSRDDWLRGCYERVPTEPGDRTRCSLVCLRCGSLIADSWEVKHYDSLHADADN